MDEHSIILLIIIALCVLMSSYFSATETAFSTFNKIKMKNMAEDGNKRAAKVMKLEDDFDTLLTTILIGNNIVNILAASLATIFFIGLIPSNESLATTLSTVVLTVVVLIFGEISPKSIAKESPEKFAMFAAPLIEMLAVVFFPLNFIFRQWKKLLSLIFKTEEDEGITEEDLITIIEEAEEDGNFDESETELIRSAIEFGDLEVGNIFTPRIDVTAIDKSTSKKEIKETFFRSGYSRLPVYDGDIDNVVGILYYKDFFAMAAGEDLENLLKPVIFVTTTMKVGDLMKELQEKKLHLAVVTDEYGSVAGIVTLEDILEEIVGDIWDEHDDIVIEIKETAEGEYIVSGKASLDKLFDELDMDSENDAQTVGGWAMDVLGKIPEEGDEFEADGLAAKVLKMDGRRVENLKITKLAPQEDESDD